MKRSLVQRFQKSQLSRSALLSLYNFWRLSITVRSYEIWTISRWWYVWNSDFKFAMTFKASERVLSNFKTTLSWLDARSYVVMLSEFWRIVWSAGSRGSVELWFVVEVATLCSDAGKVNEELRLSVSSSTSLDDVGPCWFPSSLDELGPCSLDIPELAWAGTSALWGAKLVGVYARALQSGGLLQHTNLKFEILRVYWALGTTLL